MITYKVLGGTTDFSVVVRIVDSADGTPELGVLFNTAGMAMQYRRELAANVAITEVTLAALTTAHADGGFLEIGNGYYRLDLPDAAVAAGVKGCLVHGTVTGMVVIGCYIEIVGYDPTAALATPTNITAGTITTVTNLTNAPTAGDFTATMKTSITTAVPTAAVIADAVLDEDMTAHQTQGSLGQAIGDPVADANTIYKAVVTDAAGANIGADIVAVKADTAAILVDTGTTLDARIPAALVSGRMDASVGAIAANAITATAINADAITAAKLAADVTTELQAGLATPTNITAGTITTVTNLTNAPTAGDLTATMKTSVQTAANAALTALSLDKLILASGTADSGSTTTMVDAARTEADDNYWKGRIILFTSGNIAGQCAIIMDFVAATDTFTFIPPTTQAVSTQTYVILPSISVWDDYLAVHLNSGSTGAALNAGIDSALAELAQGAPPATPTRAQALMLLYMAERNKLTVTATEKAIYNDAGTKIAKKALSDAAGTYTEDEMISGA